MNNYNYIKEEIDLANRVYNTKILNIMTTHDIQIIRGEDYQYNCFINKECWFSAFTPYGAVVLGIHLYLEKNIEEK